MKNTQSATASNEMRLAPCPFCGAAAKMETMPDVRTVLRCTNSQCYLFFNPWYSYNCGDTDEHAQLRLSTWWNNRPGEAAMKEKYKRRLQKMVNEILAAALREYQQKYGE